MLLITTIYGADSDQSLSSCPSSASSPHRSLTSCSSERAHWPPPACVGGAPSNPLLWCYRGVSPGWVFGHSVLWRHLSLRTGGGEGGEKRGGGVVGGEREGGRVGGRGRGGELRPFTNKQSSRKLVVVGSFLLQAFPRIFLEFQEFQDDPGSSPGCLWSKCGSKRPQSSWSEPGQSRLCRGQTEDLRHIFFFSGVSVEKSGICFSLLRWCLMSAGCFLLFLHDDAEDL